MKQCLYASCVLTVVDVGEGRTSQTFLKPCYLVFPRQSRCKRSIWPTLFLSPKYITSAKFITYQHGVKQHAGCLSLPISRSLSVFRRHCSNQLQKCLPGLCSHNGRRLNSFIYPPGQVDGSGSLFAVNKCRGSFLITVRASCSAGMNRILMPPVT